MQLFEFRYFVNKPLIFLQVFRKIIDKMPSKPFHVLFVSENIVRIYILVSKLTFPY